MGRALSYTCRAVPPFGHVSGVPSTLDARHRVERNPLQTESSFSFLTHSAPAAPPPVRHGVRRVRAEKPGLPPLRPPRPPSPLRPPPPPPLPPAPRSFHFPLAQPSGTAQTLSLLPFGLHLAGPPRRSFSSSSSPSRDLGFADVLTDAADAVAPAAAAPAMAWAAEDSSLAVAAVQHLIDAVHSFTGLNWWLSIALSTVLLRGVLFTLLVNGRKRFIVVQQETLAVKKLMDNAKDDKSREEAVRSGWSVLKRLGLPVFIPMIMGPYTFVTLYIAISNMVEKVPSLKGGGAFWFTDLTTPDALYIFPLITSLFLMLNLELKYCFSRTAKSQKAVQARDVCRVLFLLAAPLTASLPQAICCYFVSWSFATLAQTIVLRQPAVKKILYGEPIKPTCSSSDGPKGPTAEDSPFFVKEHVPSETRKSSDASVHRESDRSDEKSAKDS